MAKFILRAKRGLQAVLHATVKSRRRFKSVVAFEGSGFSRSASSIGGAVAILEATTMPEEARNTGFFSIPSQYKTRRS